MAHARRRAANRDAHVLNRILMLYNLRKHLCFVSIRRFEPAFLNEITVIETSTFVQLCRSHQSLSANHFKSTIMNIDAGECCLVCTNPLEWTGIGPCGHNEICSRCVARMRFVLKDKNCVLCKQECPSVFFTRYAGDYTSRLDFSLDLKVDLGTYYKEFYILALTGLLSCTLTFAYLSIAQRLSMPSMHTMVYAYR